MSSSPVRSEGNVPSVQTWGGPSPTGLARRPRPISADSPKPSINPPAAQPEHHRPAFTRKRIRGELIAWAQEKGCSHALTLVTNRSLTISRLQKMFGQLCLELDRVQLRRKNVGNALPDDRLFAIAFVEHPESNIHLHVLLRLTGWWQVSPMDSVAKCIDTLWRRIVGESASSHLVSDVDPGWGWYSSKDANVLSGDYFLSSDYHPHR